MFSLYSICLLQSHFRSVVFSSQHALGLLNMVVYFLDVVILNLVGLFLFIFIFLKEVCTFLYPILGSVLKARVLLRLIYTWLLLRREETNVLYQQAIFSTCTSRHSPGPCSIWQALNHSRTSYAVAYVASNVNHSRVIISLTRITSKSGIQLDMSCCPQRWTFSSWMRSKTCSYGFHINK